jgi:predicted PolB exonuclease-like 3'-5' exonuclease
VIQIDQHLHPVDMGGGEDRPPKLSEISMEEMLDAERKVITLAVEKLVWAVRNRCTIVTFNGKGFDLPMLRWRAAMLHVAVPTLSWYELLYPYRHKEHIDLRLLFSDGDRRARGTMAMWCEAFGIDAKTVGSGADVLGWVEKGDWNTLLSYGLDEMDDLIQLFRAVEGAL